MLQPASLSIPLLAPVSFSMLVIAVAVEFVISLVVVLEVEPLVELDSLVADCVVGLSLVVVEVSASSLVVIEVMLVLGSLKNRSNTPEKIEEASVSSSGFTAVCSVMTIGSGSRSGGLVSEILSAMLELLELRSLTTFKSG